MTFFKQLKTLPLFISHFLNAVDQHSLQSPFAFKVYSELQSAKKELQTDPAIENARMRLKKNRDINYGQDMGAGSQFANSAKGIPISTIARRGVSSPKDCKFIMGLVKLCQPSVCIELGTSLGISTAYLARSGHFEMVYSFEGNEMLVKQARSLLKSLNYGNCEIIEGNIDKQLPEVLRMIDSLGFALIDANHTSEALLRYFELLVGKMTANGIMLIDDIRWSTDMYKGWKKLTARKEVALSIEYMQKGVLVFRDGIPKQHYVVMD